jgi:hypothetical protein
MDQATRASNLLNVGKFKSVRKVTAATGAVKSIVFDRHVGRTSQFSQCQSHTRLLLEQINILKQYIIDKEQGHLRVSNDVIYIKIISIRFISVKIVYFLDV